MKVVAFNKVSFGDMPDGVLDRWKLTNDQKYLILMGKAVSSGFCEKPLARKLPGALNKARWTTTASRILRLYISTNHPSKNLPEIVEFIMKVYIPLWFLIKNEPNCYSGSKHLFTLITYAKQFSSKQIFKSVCKCLAINGYYAHSENVLLAMIGDADQNVRKRGFEIILQIRESNSASPSNSIRSSHVPNINFNCRNYTELIDIENSFEPPATFRLSNDELRYFMSAEKISIPDFSCHSQRVEHSVQAVSEVVQKVYGSKAQNGAVQAKLNSRQKYSNFKSKKDWNF